MATAGGGPRSGAPPSTQPPGVDRAGVEPQTAGSSAEAHTEAGIIFKLSVCVFQEPTGLLKKHRRVHFYGDASP